MAKMKIWRDSKGNVYVPYDDAWIRVDDLAKMLTAQDPNAISRMIMDWKIQHPAGSKEEFLEESLLSEDVVGKLW